MTKVFYDTEFLEDGERIYLISIGMVTPERDKFYFINRDAPWERIMKHQWLLDNVMPHLNFNSDTTIPYDEIAFEVKSFLGTLAEEADLELWAWYAAYDHVVLSQLFGVMARLPKYVPKFTHDLRQEYSRLGVDPAIHKLSNPAAHNALSDAEDLMRRYNTLMEANS